MTEPNPRLPADGPLEVVEARTLFRSSSVRRRMAGSLARLEGGRLLLAFALGTGPERRDDGAIVLASSDDDGATWDEPRPIFAYPGWDCLPMGGLAPLADGLLSLVVGRIRIDPTLGGDEPMTDWYVAATDSRDGGQTWSEPGPEIRLFPGWTELYGASNPHPLADGRYLWALMGTTGRDEGWHAGVAFSDARGEAFSAPTIIARAPDRNFSDTDVVRLSDGRFLAVIREHVTRQSFFAHSADEGQTWTEIQPTGFKGANLKLHRLRSGAVLCAYRDEDPARRGVGCSLSEDGGTTWRSIGQLYVAAPDIAHVPGSVCGYPDLVPIGGDELACVLHTYPDPTGRIDLHFLRLRDRT